jgi:hypothetical protein
MGCTLQDPRSNPAYSVFPEVLIDYDLDEKLTKIWVKSALSDFKYDNIRIEISTNDDLRIIEDGNTYCLSASIYYKIFNLTISVKSEENEFDYNSRIEVELYEFGMDLRIFDYITDEEDVVSKEDLPFKKVLEEV